MAFSFKDGFDKIVERAAGTKRVRQSDGCVHESLRNEVSAPEGIFLYGTGVCAMEIVAFLNTIGIPILGACDTHRKGIFSKTGHTIMTPEELWAGHPGAVVMLASLDYEQEMAGKLAQLGYHQDQVRRPLRWPVLPPREYITPTTFVENYYCGYEWAYGQFADELSREVLLGMVGAQLAGEPLSRSSDSPQYFERGIIELHEGEVFADGGAYFGDSVRSFAREAKKEGISEWCAYAFEAEPQKCEYMGKDFAGNANIEVVPRGLWSHDTELTFNISDFGPISSFTWGEANQKKIPLRVTSLDGFFNDKPQDRWPTFIKMDIEGAEVEALKGARDVLSAKNRRRPKLAICVYHAVDHVYELLRIASDSNPSYRFYLRQCVDGYGETVLYAI